MSLLIALKNNPIASMNELSHILDLAPNTVKTRLEKMKAAGVLRKDDLLQDPILGERKIAEVISYVDPYSLGLKRIYFFIKEVSSYSDYVRICQFFDKHPYTTYRALIMGQGINIYAEFQIPYKEVETLETFIKYIESQKLFKEYIMIDPTEIHRCEVDLNYWNNNTVYWDVDLYKSKEDKPSIESIFHNYRNNVQDDLSEAPTPNPKPKIKLLDLKILRELTLHGKPSINYIASFYNKDTTTISRKIQKVRDLYISHYNIAYEKSIFHLGSSYFIFGKIEKSSRYALKKMITENKIPFLTKYAEDKKFFFMRIEAPPLFVNDLVRLLLPHCSQLNQFNLHKKTNARYYFDFNNFNFDKRAWKGGEEYIIHQPLRI